MSEPLPMLNIYEVEVAGASKHLVGFLDPVLAGARGIDSRAMVGEFTPGPAGEFQLATFRVNPEFVAALTDYMNGGPSRAPEVLSQAKAIPGDWLYIVDPRNTSDPDDDPPQADVLGCYAVDSDGQVVPNSFQYNRNHEFFSTESGVSGLLADRGFYDWIHSMSM